MLNSTKFEYTIDIPRSPLSSIVDSEIPHLSLIFLLLNIKLISMKDSKLSQSSNKPQVKVLVYKVSALIKHLKIQNPSLTQAQIVWKRHHQKEQTKLINHSHGFSTFNESLSLLLDIEYDPQTKQYDMKTTELVAVIMVDGKEKSGGYAKIDVAEELNKMHEGERKVEEKEQGETMVVQLSGCLDPEGYVELQLTYELQSEGTVDEMSMWNASSRDFNMSKVDFSDFQNDPAKDIQATADKLKNLAKLIRQSKENSGQTGRLHQQKIDMIQGENKQLRLVIGDLESKLELNQSKWKSEKLEIQKQVTSLQKALEKKSKDLIQKTKELSQVHPETRNSNTEYEDKLKDLRKDSFQDESGSNPFESNAFGARSSVMFQEKVSSLERQKGELEDKVAEMSVRIANLFNAALELGGPELLDRLQQSMSLQDTR